LLILPFIALGDNYYSLAAYVPNRKWSRENQKWLYYADGLHERDLVWVKERFTPAIPSTPAKEHIAEDLAQLKIA
jgi:hypothetical protein